MLDNKGLDDLYVKFKAYHYQVTELSPQQTMSGYTGLSATKGDVTYLLDGQLYINGELVTAPNGDPFDIDDAAHVIWFTNNMEELRKQFAAPGTIQL